MKNGFPAAEKQLQLGGLTILSWTKFVTY